MKRKIAFDNGQLCLSYKKLKQEEERLALFHTDMFKREDFPQTPCPTSPEPYFPQTPYLETSSADQDREEKTDFALVSTLNNKQLWLVPDAPYREMLEHLARKGWTDTYRDLFFTDFEFNNKYRTCLPILSKNIVNLITLK